MSNYNYVNLKVDSVDSGGDIKSIFSDEVSIWLLDDVVTIDVNTKLEEDYRIVTIQLTKIQAKVFADVILRYAKNL